MFDYEITLATISFGKLYTVFLHNPGGMALVEQLKKDPALSGQSEAAVALDAMQLLLHYCSILGIADKVSEGQYLVCKVLSYEFFSCLTLCSHWHDSTVWYSTARYGPLIATVHTTLSGMLRDSFQASA